VPDNWVMISCIIRHYPIPRHIQSACRPCPAFYPTGTALCSQYLTLIPSTLTPLCVLAHYRQNIYKFMSFGTWCGINYSRVTDISEHPASSGSKQSKHPVTPYLYTLTHNAKYIYVHSSGLHWTPTVTTYEQNNRTIWTLQKLINILYTTNSTLH